MACEDHVSSNFSLLLRYSRDDGTFDLGAAQAAYDQEGLQAGQTVLAASDDGCVLADGVSISVSASGGGGQATVEATVSVSDGPVRVTINYTAGGDSTTQSVTTSSTATKAATFQLPAGSQQLCANVVNATPV